MTVRCPRGEILSSVFSSCKSSCVSSEPSTALCTKCFLYCCMPMDVTQAPTSATVQCAGGVEAVRSAARSAALRPHARAVCGLARADTGRCGARWLYDAGSAVRGRALLLRVPALEGSVGRCVRGTQCAR